MENTENKTEDEGEVQPLAAEATESPAIDPQEIQKELAAKEKELESYKLQMRQMQAAQAAPQKKAPNPLLLPEDQYSVDPQRFNQMVNYMEKLEEELIETKKEAAKATMRSRYDDFDAVVNDASVDKLALEQPDIVDTVFRSTSKPSARLNTLYHILKGNKPSMRPVSPTTARRRVQSPQTMPTSSRRDEEYSYAGHGPSPEMEEKWMREMEPHMPGHMQGRRIK